MRPRGHLFVRLPAPPARADARQVPPICNPNKPTQQIGAKTYPTQRELLLAKLMRAQGFVSSLCPIHVQPAAGQTELTDPLFGYNPAVNGIVDRLKIALNNQCLPEKLVPDSCGTFPCLILVTLRDNRDGEQACTTTPGMSIPEADILKRFQQKQHGDWMAGGLGRDGPEHLADVRAPGAVPAPAGCRWRTVRPPWAPSAAPPPVPTRRRRAGATSRAPLPADARKLSSSRMGSRRAMPR